MGTLRLYQVDFEPTDNFYIEDIESYFKTLPSTSMRGTWDNLNYLKLGMNITLKLPLPQEKQINNTANYAVIEQDDSTYYYFITDARWIARKTVQLLLTLDTVETFFTKLKWSSKTQITRETQDRFIKLNTNYYLRKIDRYNEGMNPVKVDKVSTKKIETNPGGKWYLVYMSNPATTQDATGNPMFMGLLADKSYKIADAGTSTASKTISIETNRTYWITDSGVGDGSSITIGDTEYKLDGTKGNATKRVIGFYTTGSVISYKELYYTGDTYPYSYSEGNSWKATLFSGNRITIKNARVIHSAPFTDYYNGITSVDKIDSLNPIEVNAGTYPALATIAFNDFDNSNPRLSKIIELPYPPLTVTQSGSNYTFADCSYHYGYNILQVNSDTLMSYLGADNRLQDLLYVTISNPTAKDTPNINLESKLYSSEFYDYSYYYDTEKQTIRLEDVVTDELNCYIGIRYYQTTTMNSDKQFEFVINNGSYKENQPYELFMNSARSTEKMILNDSYADYIKNGYNYDLWNQKRTEKLAAINTIVSTIGAAASFAPGVLSGVGAVGNALAAKRKAEGAFFEYRTLEEPSGEVYMEPAYTREEQLNMRRSAQNQLLQSFSGVGALVVNQGINSVNSAINASASIEANRRAFTESVNTKANTPIGASGSTPTDLFDNYSDNKLTRFEFRIKGDDRNNVWNTLRTMGYSHPVQEVPIFTGRIYSNFIQCKPVFLNSLTEIYKVYLDDISLRFQAGVTVKHSYKGKYDLYDEYENYENFIMED